MSLHHPKRFRGTAYAVCTAGLLGIAAVQPAAAQQPAATDAQMKAWHSDLKTYAPVESGCFHASYPSLQWQKVSCGPAPAFISGRRPQAKNTHEPGKTRAAFAAGGAQVVGNGYDYVAQTAQVMHSSAGTFPSATGITSESSKGVAAFGGGGLLGANEYSIQLNSDITENGTACSAFGYASCDVWEQFVYSTKYQSYPSEIFIQNWVFPSETDYENSGCPSGWNDASSTDSPACYKNSAATNVPNVSPKSLATLELSGAVSGGRDTLVFTEGSQAYSTSEADSTVYLGSWWTQSEFNVVGNAGGSRANFNKGVSITVKLVVQDGAATAPTCVSDSGTTGETNNLNLGACKTASGSSPSITFTESN